MRSVCLALALLAACAEPPSDSGARADPIVGGYDVTDGGFAAVYMLRSEFDNGVRAGCTATLITPRTLLTAAHCVDPRKAGATSVQLFAVGLAVAPIATDPAWVQATESRFHPQYVPGDLFSFDIAVVLLPAAASVTPVPWSAQGATALIGQPLTAVGYGIASEGATDYGTRRAVNLTVRDVTAKHVVLGDQTAKGICDGDSGGPSLVRFGDGVTRVIGVHSYKQPSGACHDGLDTRVDLFADFVRQWISEKEGPTCGEDGLCKSSGCASVDPDCVTLVPRGEACVAGVSVCVAGTACVDFGAGAHCTNPCTGFTGCQTGEECSEADAGLRYCRLPDRVLLELDPELGAAAQGKSAGGCSAAGAGPVGLLGVARLRRRRRR